MSKLHDRIVEMAKKRMPPRIIANHLKINVDDVYHRLRMARKDGEVIPNFNNKSVMPADAVLSHQLVIPSRLHGLLEKEAAVRGKTPTEFAQGLLEGALLGGKRA